MHSSFYHIPLRDMFVRRVLWNMPKINPDDYKTDVHDQTLPESPPIPPLSPPRAIQHEQQSYSKRRKRSRTEPSTESPKLVIAKPKQKSSSPKMSVVPTAEPAPRTELEERLWVPVPNSSSKEKIKELQERLKQDPNVCRFCADTFCRDPTWGDPYLISCSRCNNKYHSFCVDSKPERKSTMCYRCLHAPKPKFVMRTDDDPAILCQFCHRNSPGVAGRLIRYGGLGDTAANYVHENCAFYSKGVTKKDVQWFGLHSAVRESHLMKCAFCHKKGASIPCEFPKCRKLFHYLCAKDNSCYMVENDLQHLFCNQHMEAILKNPNMLNPVKSTPFQILPTTPTSPESAIHVPQLNSKKKLSSKKRVRISFPDKEGEEEVSPSCQVL